MTGPSIAQGLVCPVPSVESERVLLGHGSGGKLSAQLLRDHFLPHLGNPTLAPLGDAALLVVQGGELAVSTDSFVVSPIEFPGGNIGSLAVHGSLNDLAMMGAEPIGLTAGFILEEGLPFEVLDRVVAAMGEAARANHVSVVTGDTKVVDRGKADRLFINTTGLGIRRANVRIGPDKARIGDKILVSGPVGRHGMCIMAEREGIGFESPIVSDSAALWPVVKLLLDGVGDAVHAMRDPTRGGLASALNEIAASSQVGVVLEDGAVPVPGPVAAACEMLGLDPMYVANEGVFTAFVAPDRAEEALAIVRSHPLGAGAALVGTATAEHRGFVILRTGLGGTRIVDLLPGDQLPRIC
ncbi:MAG: hydrogenase expression/formation protein HypE [Gemmatimonadales bacterium]